MTEVQPGDISDQTPVAESVTSSVQISALTRAFGRINTAGTDNNTVVYNGRAMTAEQARGLTALLDEFQFTVQYDGEHPDVRIEAAFTKLPLSSSRSQLNPTAGYARFYAGVTYQYAVDDYNPVLPFIVVEQALIDMRKKTTMNGTPVARYAQGWINVAIPLAAFVSICRHITAATDYAIDDRNFTKTADEQYVTTVASISENKNPEMCMIRQVEGTDDEFVQYSLGSVGEAYANDDINDVAVGFIAFSVGLNCEVALGIDSVPHDVQPKLKLRLGPSRILAAAPTRQLT